MVLGITGKYCAGKSTVAALFAERGFLHIEVDHLGHEALEHRRDEVAARFGSGVVGPDGSIDRRALGRIVFSDSTALRDLESIVHPEMVRIVGERISADPDGRLIVNAALLFRMKLDALCDSIVWVDAPLPVRVFRAMRRDGLGLLAIATRMRSQADVALVASQHSSPGVDIMRVTNACGRRRLTRNVERIVRAIDSVR